MAGQSHAPARFFTFSSRSLPLAALICGAMLAVLAGADAPPPPATAASQPATRTAEQKKQEDISRVMEFFRITQPDVYDQAVMLRETDPKKFEKLISGASSTVNRLENTRRKNPRLFELQMQDLKYNYQTLRLAHQLQDKNLNDKQRKEFTAQLKKLVADEFDVQQAMRRLEIEDLKNRISDLEVRVCDREKDKGDIIGKRIEDLVERTPKLEW